MVVDPITVAAPIASKAVLPLVSLLGRQLSGDEERMVRRSFQIAIRDEREQQLLHQTRRLKRTRKRLRRVKEQVTPSGRSDRRDEKELAQWLAQTWAAASVEDALGLNTDPSPAAEGARPSEKLPQTWSAALIYFLKSAALEGVADEPPSAADDEQAEAWHKRRGAWGRVLLRSSAIDDALAEDWAGKIANRVVRYWRGKPALHALIAQLNYDSRQGLVQAIALSGQDVARSLRRLVAATMPTILIGGGGMALIVLYVDKG
jgi:hypothetical protein